MFPLGPDEMLIMQSGGAQGGAQHDTRFRCACGFGARRRALTGGRGNGIQHCPPIQRVHVEQHDGPASDLGDLGAYVPINPDVEIAPTIENSARYGKGI